MKCRHHILFLSLLTVPLQSSVVLSEPLSQRDCLPSNCQHQWYSQKPNEGGRRGGGNPDKLMEQLNLSNSQIQQLNTIRQKYRPQMDEMREKIDKSRQELDKMMQGNSSVTDLRKKHQEVINLDQKLHNLRFESMLEMRAVLTPEQRTQFAQLMQQRRESRRNNRGNATEASP
ncbi:protein of unknown function Spy-related [Rippkaea orientalis PCC 8801]|uniref:Periplasmic heavy metal sensor n=1 Tax=Rippkaea orientalis (strain PCC 8801 / RF-1) TaxID=41431 RepID=B7JWK4_RIPO1|nr:Spy/CpxP family protein refolding chaperone [Rippkaea orientalis]ACK68345.1 protein of unknown function Spy-related [Rippkaea orientalis PCC 8801]